MAPEPIAFSRAHIARYCPEYVWETLAVSIAVQLFGTSTEAVHSFVGGGGGTQAGGMHTCAYEADGVRAITTMHPVKNRMKLFMMFA